MLATSGPSTGPRNGCTHAASEQQLFVRKPPSFELFAFEPVVHGLVFRPAVYFENFQFRFLAPVHSRSYGLRPDDRVVRVLGFGVRPLLHRQQLLHQLDHPVSFEARHVQLFRRLRLERSESTVYDIRKQFYTVDRSKAITGRRVQGLDPPKFKKL